MPESRNLPRLMALARTLGPLRDRVVFVGGARSTCTAPAPVPAPGTSPGLGFANDVASGVICRWQFQGLTVDVMPMMPEILGFSNPWYPMGFAQAMTYVLPDATPVRILSPVYFVATKLVALRDRSWHDLGLRQDLDDLVHVVDNRRELAGEIAADVRADTQRRLAELLAHPHFLEAVEWTLPYGSGYERKYEIARRLEQIRAGVST